MPFDRLGSGLAAAALLAFGAPSPVAGEKIIMIPLCHGGNIPLSVPAHDDQGPGKPCPAGCHALCFGQRKSMSEDGGSEGD
jgi:hypothetical protein